MKTINICEKANTIFMPIIDKLGFVLVEINYKKEFNGMVLSVCLDKEGGINIKDCEAFSRLADKILDDFDLTNGQPYTFNVSSYGLDRHLKTDYDFKKFLNKEIILKFYKPFLNTKELKAKLKDFSRDTLTVEVELENIVIEKTEICNIKPYINFKGENNDK